MKEKKWMWLIMIAAVLVITGGSGVATASADASWQATYWNNTTLSGAPVLQQPETTLMNDWGSQSPAEGIVEGDGFSARWTRTLDLGPGNYP